MRLLRLSANCLKYISLLDLCANMQTSSFKLKGTFGLRIRLSFLAPVCNQTVRRQARPNFQDRCLDGARFCKTTIRIVHALPFTVVDTKKKQKKLRFSGDIFCLHTSLNVICGEIFIYKAGVRRSNGRDFSGLPHTQSSITFFCVILAAMSLNARLDVFTIRRIIWTWYSVGYNYSTALCSYKLLFSLS